MCVSSSLSERNVLVLNLVRIIPLAGVEPRVKVNGMLRRTKMIPPTLFTDLDPE